MKHQPAPRAGLGISTCCWHLNRAHSAPVLVLQVITLLFDANIVCSKLTVQIYQVLALPLQSLMIIFLKK